jgi:hypothetical protein
VDAHLTQKRENEEYGKINKKKNKKKKRKELPLQRTQL